MNIINRLKTLPRYRHRIIDNDDYIDDFPQECDYGPYVMWSDIQKIINKLAEFNKIISLNNDE